MVLVMVFTKYYAGSTNKVGQGFTVLWIFIFSIIFSLGYGHRLEIEGVILLADTHRYNAIQLVYIAEIFPTALRSRATASKLVLLLRTV